MEFIWTVFTVNWAALRHWNWHKQCHASIWNKQRIRSNHCLLWFDICTKPILFRLNVQSYWIILIWHFYDFKYFFVCFFFLLWDKDLVCCWWLPLVNCPNKLSLWCIGPYFHQAAAEPAHLRSQGPFEPEDAICVLIKAL